TIAAERMRARREASDKRGAEERAEAKRQTALAALEAQRLQDAINQRRQRNAGQADDIGALQVQPRHEAPRIAVQGQAPPVVIPTAPPPGASPVPPAARGPQAPPPGERPLTAAERLA